MQQDRLLLTAESRQEEVADLIEITFRGDARLQLPLILPMLSQLTYESGARWLTYVGTALLSKRDCRRVGLNWLRLLQVLPSVRCNVIDIAERALTSGRSHTVVAMTESCSAMQLRRLESAAKEGKCRCILIRAR